MTTRTRPKQSRADAVLGAHEMPELVECNAARLEAATLGRIGAYTAIELPLLADGIARFAATAARVRRVGAPTLATLRTMTTLRTAVRTAKSDEPLVEAQLREAPPARTASRS